MEIKDDAAMRGLVLGLLYAGKERNFVLVKPESFTPPMEKRDIRRIGFEFKDADLIKGTPSDNGDGFFMRISILGCAVWERKSDTLLDISGLPSE